MSKKILAKIRMYGLLLEEANAELAAHYANKRFGCCCGKTHAFKDCEAIQTHWYERPHGCTGGDQWHSGEVQIICPTTSLRNRILFKSYYTVPYEYRNKFEHNAEAQFKRRFLPLFKSVRDTFKEESEPDTRNNYSIDEHHQKYGIEIKPWFTVPKS